MIIGLWIEDIETKGHKPIRYFDTWEELDEELKEWIGRLPKEKRLFKVKHDYDKKSNVITEFNYDERIYI